MTQSKKEIAERKLARYNAQFEKFSAMPLEELRATRSKRLSQTDERALTNAIFHLEHPLNKKRMEMSERTNSYILQSDARIDNIVAVRYPVDDFIFCVVGAKDISEEKVNEKYMPAILTDTWFDYLKFEKTNERWEKQTPEGMLFYSEIKNGFLQCVTDTDPQLVSNYVHQLQNHWIDVCGTSLTEMRRTLKKAISL